MAPRVGGGESSSAPDVRLGVLYGIAAYGLWGFMPLFFLATAPAGAVELVSVRVIFSLLLCLAILPFARGWQRLAAVLRDRRSTLALGAAALLVMANWTIFLFAVLSEHILEAALGYFINPLLTILVGVVFYRERLSPVQWTAVGLSAVAIVVLTVDYGHVPWFALGVATSFAIYGVIKKAAVGGVDALTGMTVESMWLTPIALGLIAFVWASGDLTMFSHGVGHFVLLVLAGPVTLVPLLLFAAAARRVPLSYLGLTQFLAPIMQFLVGYFLMHEEMSSSRWVGFGLVWLALVLITVDMFRGHRQAVAEG